jgi:hypothetical protein
MVVTPEMVKAWQDACDDFKSAGEPDAYSLEEVKKVAGVIKKYRL